MNTKEKKFSVAWIVVAGPDWSHLVEHIEVFNRLRDAERRYAELAPMPRELWRHCWTHPLSTDGSRALIRTSRGVA